MAAPLILTLQSCISEAQKYEGSHYRDRNAKRSNPPSAPVTPGYSQPAIEDAPDSTPRNWAVAEVNVPPPAPSPPPAASPVNVFDFLIPNESRSASVSSRSTPEPEAPRRIKQQPVSPKKKRVQVQEDSFTYGDAPVQSSSTKYPSELSLAMEVEQPSTKPNSSIHRTPAPKHASGGRESAAKPANSGSEKKRKRPPVEELDLSESRKSSQELSDTAPTVLHSGLTGGLGKLLGNKEAQQEQPSPLSPKKRTKHPRFKELDKLETDSADGGRERRHKKKQDNTRQEDDDGTARHRRHKRHRSDGDDTVKALEAPPEFKAIEYHHNHDHANGARSNASSRQSFHSHSQFFLSLVDKMHTSQKGQSIYGTLKSFHDGICNEDERAFYEESGDKAREEKKLLKALRMKVNRNGEIVLFARPDFEEAEDGVKRIEAP